MCETVGENWLKYDHISLDRCLKFSRIKKKIKERKAILKTLPSAHDIVGTLRDL